MEGIAFFIPILGERLAHHVHLEQREFFALIETTIPEPDLQELVDACAG
jgi:hypothetical protein